MNKLSITYKIVGIKPCSTNDMYFSMPIQSKTKTYKNGKPRLSTRKISTPELKNFKSTMSQELSIRIPEEFISKAKARVDSGDYYINLRIYIGMPDENYKSSDSSNYIKAYEDCIAERLGIDDSNNDSVSATKYISTDWELLTIISVEDKSVIYEELKGVLND